MILSWRPVDGIQTSLTEAETNKLRHLSAGRSVLEVGSAYGYSAIQMCRAATHVLAVDPHAGENLDSLQVMRANLHRHGVVDRVTIMLGRSEHVLPALLHAGIRFGLVFIDGDHSTAAVKRDIKNALHLTSPGGVIACHDYGEDSCPGVKEAIDDLCAGNYFECAEIDLVDTLWSCDSWSP